MPERASKDERGGPSKDQILIKALDCLCERDGEFRGCDGGCVCVCVCVCGMRWQSPEQRN